jgi:hypothetical protein
MWCLYQQYWAPHFDAQGIPNALKDGSSAAVMATTFIKLSCVLRKKKRRNIFR